MVSKHTLNTTWKAMWVEATYRVMPILNYDFKEISIEEFVETIRRWYADIPYSITDKNQNEQLYQFLIYAALMGYWADVQAEDRRTIDSFIIAGIKSK